MICEPRRPDRLSCSVGLRYLRNLDSPLLPPLQHVVERSKQERIEQDRNDRAGKDQIPPLLGKERQAHAEASENEGELADLGERRRDRKCRRRGITEPADDGEG